jgi:NAD(P)-dependent dehydrogenase (short-subunit alcohol dehydrogenase family)
MTATAAKRILITGGSGGIGSAIAVACAKRGAWPLIGYCAREDRARQALELCGAGELVRLDLMREDCGIDGLCPRADAVVHCAGAITRQRRLMESTDEEVLHLFTMNALGPLRLTRRLLQGNPSLRHAIFVLSTAIACRGSGPYAVSKTAGLAIAKLLSVELEACGVRVDALVPGWTNTEMARFAAQSMGKSIEDVQRQHPSARILQPEEVGELCARLLLDEDLPREPQLVLWDTRLSPGPIWRGLRTVLAFDTLTPDEKGLA